MNPVKLKQIWWLISTGMILGSCSDVGQLARAAVNPVLQQPQPSAQSFTGLAQASSVDTGCRQTNTSTGVYSQPNLDSASRGILQSGQTVRLELIGTGTGWARITEPVVGWVEAKYLTPAAACPGTAATSIAPTPTAAQPNGTQTVTVICEVLPSEGLVVRSEPNIIPTTALHTIPKGTHQFQFTNQHTTTQVDNVARRWSYITAPYPGWISLGIIGGSFNLGGRECG